MNTKDFLLGFINHVIDWNQTITSDLSSERFESKFVHPGEFDEHAELDLARNKYAGQFNNIVVTTGLFQGHEVKMIRADGGKVNY